MKKYLSLAVCLTTLLCAVITSGCAQSKVIDGVEYDTHGLFNKDEKRNPNIQYELSWGNIILGVVLFETIVAPIYFYGFSMWEPVGKKTEIVEQVVK